MGGCLFHIGAPRKRQRRCRCQITSAPLLSHIPSHYAIHFVYTVNVREDMADGAGRPKVQNAGMLRMLGIARIAAATALSWVSRHLLLMLLDP